MQISFAYDGEIAFAFDPIEIHVVETEAVFDAEKYHCDKGYYYAYGTFCMDKSNPVSSITARNKRGENQGKGLLDPSSEYALRRTFFPKTEFLSSELTFQSFDFYCFNLYDFHRSYARDQKEIFDLVLTLEDGTEVVFEDKLEYPGAEQARIDAARVLKNNSKDYIYIELSGNLIDTKRLDFSFAYNDKELDAQLEGISNREKSTVLKFRKLHWNEEELWRETKTIMFKIMPKEGYDVILPGQMIYVSDFHNICYDEKTDEFVICSNLTAAGKTFIIKYYDELDDNKVLGSTEFMVNQELCNKVVIRDEEGRKIDRDYVYIKIFDQNECQVDAYYLYIPREQEEVTPEEPSPSSYIIRYAKKGNEIVFSFSDVIDFDYDILRKQKYSLELSKDGVKVPVVFKEYLSRYHDKFGIRGSFDSSSLEAGDYTLALSISGDKMLESKFTLFDCEQFLLLGEPRATLNKDQSLEVFLDCLNCQEDDLMILELLDDQEQVIKSYEGRITFAGLYNTIFTIEDFEVGEVLHSYKVRIANHRSGQAYQADGEWISSMNMDVFCYETNRFLYNQKGIYGINIREAAFPLKVELVANDDTDAYVSMVISDDQDDSNFYFSQEDLKNIPDDEDYVIIILTDANGIVESEYFYTKGDFSEPQKNGAEVEYHLDGGVNHEDNPRYVSMNDLIYILQAPTKEGYEFDGWYYDEAYTKAIEFLDTSDTETIHVYAKWKAREYQITYENCSRAKNSNPTTYVGDSGKLSLKAPTRTGYTFKGWYADSKFKTKVKEIDTSKAEDITVYAKWEANTYRVHFDGNGGFVTMFDGFCTYDKSYPLPPCFTFRWGYQFKGWNTKKDGTGKAFKEGSKILNLTSQNGKTVTLYAQWGK